jgi:hypothetical protein
MYSQPRTSISAMVASLIMPRSATMHTRWMPKCICKRERLSQLGWPEIEVVDKHLGRPIVGLPRLHKPATAGQSTDGASRCIV